MKQFNKISIGLLLFAFLFSPTLIAQEEAPEAAEEKASTNIMVVTKVHWNFEKEDGSQDEWLAIEKEWFDKVTAKNEYILASNFLSHAFTADNSEAIIVSVYGSWDDMEKSNDRTNELVKEGWPDEAAGDTYFDTRNSYYTGHHSDEIYSVLDGSKNLAEKPTEPLLYYVRVSHIETSPENVVDGEMKEIKDQWLENVINKNSYIKAYYNYRHMWGADNREYTEVFAVGSLCDVQASFDENQRLSEAAWTEEERKEMGKKRAKYFTGFHADYMWSNFPELMK